MESEILVTTGSGNGLMLDGNKSLPEPLLTYHQQGSGIHSRAMPSRYELTHWGRDEMNNISQMTFSNVFSSMKMFEFRLKFHWSLFPRVELTIFQHWFRWWLGAVQATSHYLNQWCLVYQRIYVSLSLSELNIPVSYRPYPMASSNHHNLARNFFLWDDVNHEVENLIYKKISRILAGSWLYKYTSWQIIQTQCTSVQSVIYLPDYTPVL